jgi:hypothetical protein
VPPEQVTNTQVLTPITCRRCGNSLAGSDPAPYLGVPIALGSIANLEQATSEAIATKVEEIARAFPAQPVVHADVLMASGIRRFMTLSSCRRGEDVRPGSLRG